MLVLTRKAGESIDVGESGKIRILKISGGKVKIGLDFENDIPILRSEIEPDSGIYVCDACNGSGEGRAEGLLCAACRGLGIS